MDANEIMEWLGVVDAEIRGAGLLPFCNEAVSCLNCPGFADKEEELCMKEAYLGEALYN